MQFDLPEVETKKRESVLYAYIKKENKVWLDSLAKEKEMRLSSLLDQILDDLRQQSVHKKVKKTAKKTA